MNYNTIVKPRDSTFMKTIKLIISFAYEYVDDYHFGNVHDISIFGINYVYGNKKNINSNSTFPSNRKWTLLSYENLLTSCTQIYIVGMV